MARILVVDDDPTIVEACRLVLEREGYEVLTAGSREEGAAVLAGESPDLLILDVMMEEADSGIAMVQALRREGNRIPVLLLTSVGKVSGMTYGRDDDVVPVDAYYEKPIEPATLVEIVGDLLGRKGGH